MLFVVALVFGFAFNPAHAATGIDYLSAQQNVDGSLGNTATSLATPVQTTAETLRVYQALSQQNQFVYAPALSYLNSGTEANTEFLARKIVVNAQAGNNVTALISDLLTHQNSDGGFGDQPDYASSALDTAYALEALVAARYSSGQLVPAAVGYLLNQQNANGGWAVEDNDPSVFVTAQIMRALWHYRYQYTQVPVALNRARDFLLSQRDGSGSWGEDFNTALSLIALVPYLTDIAGITDSINSLQAAQLSNGSWENDPYTTALALHALALVSQPQTNPEYSTIRGKVVDAQTGLPLGGVTVVLSGAASASFVTLSDGVFMYESLPTGSFGLSLTLTDYASLSVTTVASSGQTVDLGVLPMVKSTGATTGTVKGVVTDGATGLPLGGVTVSITGGASAVTAIDGQYQISNVAPGAITAQATLTGYSSATGSGNMTAGGVLVFSPTLFPVTAPTTAIQGVVTDGTSGVPLPGVSIAITGSTSASVTTSAQGAYRIGGLNPGSITITVSLTGYDSAGGSVNVAENTIYTFSPKLYPQDTSPPEANTAGVKGVVVDAGTNSVLSGVTVSAYFGGAQRTTTTGAAGQFEFTGLMGDTGILQFSLTNYTAASLAVMLDPLTTLELGQIRLRREDAVLGLISATTDKSAYGPNSPVILQGLVLNSGSLTSAYNVELRVEDQNGALVQGFAPQVVTGLGSGNTTTVTNNWNTAALLAGSYRLHATLRDAQGRPLDEHAALFTIGINNPTCGQPTINMVATPATIPGDDPANRTPILRFTFEDTSELVPLSSIPAYPETLVNDPSYPAFSPWNELFVANRHGNVPGSAGSIARFTFDEAGNFVANGAITGNSLEAVHGIAFSPWGELFAANLLSGTISRFKFDANGNAIPNGTFHSGTPRAQGLAFSPNGELFITDSVNNPNVQRWRFDPATRAPIYNGFFSVPGARSSHGLAFDSKGELFIGDIGADRIYRYRFDDAGSAIGNGIIPALDPIGIAFSPAGEMFVTGHASGGISRFLFDQNGNVIPNGVIPTPNLGGIAIQPILRNPDNDCIPAATTAITANQPVYDAWDDVTLTGRVRNTAPNMILAPTRVELSVRSPAGTVLLTETRSVGELVPGALRDLPFSMALVDAAMGGYPVEMILKDASTGTVLSTSATSFQVQRRAIQALTGDVTVNAPQVYQGDEGVCTEVARNISGVALSGVRLIHQLISVDTGTVVNEVVETVDLAAGGVVYSYFRNIDTTGLSLGGYTCVIKAELNGEEKTLAFGGFKIVEPPVRIAAELRVGSRGRLLVILDHAAQSPDPAVADSDPFGPDIAPALTVQRAFLEKLLKKAGWSYTIADTAEDFARELRTGGYSVYALFTEQEKLAEQVQKELREAVFRGEGLLEAGSHDQRQGRVDEALGIKYIGQINDAKMIEMTPSPLHDGGQEAFLFDDRVLRAELEGAQSAGRYLGGSGDRRDAVTRHEYGAGKSVYAGFDLLVQATAAGEQSLFAGLILNSLAYVHPASFTAVSGAVVPVDIALTNEGIAAHVKVQFVLPAGAQLTDAGTAQVNNGAMTWEMAMTAGEIKTLKFWLRLPAPNSPLTLMATVEAGANSQTLKLMAEPTLTLTVNDPESLTSVLSRIDALLNNRHPDSQSLKLARKFIEKALGNLHPALAIDDLLKAADSLVDIADPDVVSIRVAIGLWIRWASPYAY